MTGKKKRERKKEEHVPNEHDKDGHPARGIVPPRGGTRSVPVQSARPAIVNIHFDKIKINQHISQSQKLQTRQIAGVVSRAKSDSFR